MQLLLIRHAIAEERDVFAATGQPDDRRPLTARGRSRMERAARGIVRLEPELTLLISSPLTRALETAGIVAQEYGGLPIEQTDTLVPDAGPELFASWIEQRVRGGIVAAVGHEPHLGDLAAWLLAADAASFYPFKKGGACLLSMDGSPGPGSATLVWALPPRVLRRVSS